MVEVGTGTGSSRFLKRNWPITDGLTAGTEKQEGRQPLLQPENSNVITKEKEGLY